MRDRSWAVAGELRLPHPLFQNDVPICKTILPRVRPLLESWSAFFTADRGKTVETCAFNLPSSTNLPTFTFDQPVSSVAKGDLRLDRSMIAQDLSDRLLLCLSQYGRVPRPCNQPKRGNPQCTALFAVLATKVDVLLRQVD